MLEVYTDTVEETENLGKALGKVFRGDEVVLLNGELGTGKTALTRGIVLGAGGDPTQVHSPSYTYLNIYDADYQVFHIDVYLLEAYDDFYEIGISEMFNKGLMLIEWGGRFINEIPLPVWQINISYFDHPSQRKIIITAPKEKEDILKELISIGNTNV